MISDIQIKYGFEISRQGNSRLCALYQSNNISVNKFIATNLSKKISLPAFYGKIKKKPHSEFSIQVESTIFAHQNLKVQTIIIKKKMTKAEIVNEISKKTGIDRATALTAVEAFMESVKESLSSGENVYLRGFGSFIVKKRAQKTARNISKNTTLIIPEHNIPAFKPAKTFTINAE
ncbi:MAG: integration host factor subunit beta [Bacteroidales bacterium]|nr:integration host factor subunit beta [Bacteroidales bacterium]